MRRILSLFYCASWAWSCAHGQSANEQLWVDLEIGKVSSEWTFSTELSARTLLTGSEPHWTSWNVSPTVERSMSPHWDLIAGVPLSYTTQTDEVTSGEADIQLGTRYLFTPFKRIQTNLLVRYEQRYLTTFEPERTWEDNVRTRVRAEVKIPLDTRNYYADTMWYALLDCEAFITLDEDLSERFANRLRTRAGIGTKFNYNWRAELIYTYQRSRRAISDDVLTTDNILRIRLKYYFSRKDQKHQRSDPGF